MRRPLALAATLMLSSVALLGGCSSKATKQPTQKEVAFQQWNNARSSVLLGLATDQYKTGNYDKSRQTVTEALKMSPENPDLWILSAKLNIEQGQLDPAHQDLTKAVGLKPDAAEAHYLLGVVYQRWQQYPEALSAYQAASDHAPSDLAYVLARVEVLVSMDRGREAYALLEEKTKFFENNPAIRDAAGQLLMQQKRYDEAVEVFRKASLLATDDQGIRERLAKALFYSGQHREAADLISRLLRDERNAGGRADLQILLGEASLQSDRPSEARAAFETATQLNPASVQGWQGIAKVALNGNDLRRAELAIRKALSLDGADAQNQLLLGYLRLRQERLDDALLAFRKAVTLDETDTTALCMAGYVYEQKGNHDEAMQFYGKALKIRPDDDLATKLMASVGTGE